MADRPLKTGPPEPDGDPSASTYTDVYPERYPQQTARDIAICLVQLYHLILMAMVYELNPKFMFMYVFPAALAGFGFMQVPFTSINRLNLFNSVILTVMATKFNPLGLMYLILPYVIMSLFKTTRSFHNDVVCSFISAFAPGIPATLISIASNTVFLGLNDEHDLSNLIVLNLHDIKRSALRDPTISESTKRELAILIHHCAASLDRRDKVGLTSYISDIATLIANNNINPRLLLTIQECYRISKKMKMQDYMEIALITLSVAIAHASWILTIDHKSHTLHANSNPSGPTVATPTQPKPRKIGVFTLSKNKGTNTIDASATRKRIRKTTIVHQSQPVTGEKIEVANFVNLVHTIRRNRFRWKSVVHNYSLVNEFSAYGREILGSLIYLSGDKVPPDISRRPTGNMIRRAQKDIDNLLREATNKEHPIKVRQVAAEYYISLTYAKHLAATLVDEGVGPVYPHVVVRNNSYKSIMQQMTAYLCNQKINDRVPRHAITKSIHSLSHGAYHEGEWFFEPLALNHTIQDVLNSKIIDIDPGTHHWFRKTNEITKTYLHKCAGPPTPLRTMRFVDDTMYHYNEAHGDQSDCDV